MITNGTMKMSRGDEMGLYEARSIYRKEGVQTSYTIHEIPVFMNGEGSYETEYAIPGEHGMCYKIISNLWIGREIQHSTGCVSFYSFDKNECLEWLTSKKEQLLTVIKEKYESVQNTKIIDFTEAQEG